MTKYSIGIVTYVKRFEKFFKPLVLSLEKYFPRVEKNYVLNGFYDRAVQQDYLEKAREFLRGTSASNVVAYDENQSLSKCWNQLVLHSAAPKILIMNDDVEIGRLFKWCLEAQMRMFEAAVINKSWSHFFISKNTIRQVGWFEERFPGVGHEDADYALRMALAGGRKFIPRMFEHNIYCFGIHNIVAKNEDPGWKQVSASINNKYTSANSDFFDSKWESSPKPLEGGINAYGQKYMRIKPGMETSMFYDFALLDRPLKSPLI